MAAAVEIEDRGRVRVIWMNRPETLNAMNETMFGDLREALDAASEAPEVAVAVVSGRGRAYCAGLDLAAGPASNFADMLKALAYFRKPLLAAVNGLGVGIGMTMLAHCDLVFMARSARLRTPFPQLGLAPEAGSSYAFAARMGWPDAAYALLSGRWFTAEECRAMGIAWRLADDDRVLDAALEVAGELAANPIPSLIATKELMLRAGRADRSWAAHEREQEAYAVLMGGPANVEAFEAFREKREPDFSGIPGL